MGDVTHLRTKLAPAAQRKRFDRLLERIAEYGDLAGNEGEICWLRNLCEEMFEELYAPVRCRVLDSISKQLREAAAEYRRENSRVLDSISKQLREAAAEYRRENSGG